MNASSDCFRTYYDGFSIQKIGNRWVASHDHFDYESLSSVTLAGVTQRIDDFYNMDKGSLDDELAEYYLNDEH